MLNKLIIHKDNLINNIKQVKFENPNSKICAMVKANAYGVGDIEVVKILEPYVDFWGVACFFEAQRIKELTTKRILIVGPIEKSNIDLSFSYTCGSIEDLNYLVSLKKSIHIHLKINTGMNRYGFNNIKTFKKALSIISKSNLVIEGIFTHFATCDEFVNVQMKKFQKFVKACNNLGYNPICHADNSFVNEKFNHKLDMVRIGFNLYNCNQGWFLPIAEIVSEIVQINSVKKGELVGYDYRCVANKDMKVAILPIGYADGFLLNYINMELIINNKPCKVLNVCMDCIMVDVSKLKFKKGDKIYILNKFNSLSVFAKHARTSEYEVMTNFSKIRAVRIIV